MFNLKRKIMEILNIAELLKDCPKGMELDCTMYENVVFDCIAKDNDAFPIKCHIKLPNNQCAVCSFTAYGCCSLHNYSKCVIFPKGKTTWEGFSRPFKDGDIIYTYTGYSWLSIYKSENYKSIFSYLDYEIDTNEFSIIGTLCNKIDIIKIRLATEKEKQKLFDAIKANGYKWNAETRTLEKLINKNKFVIGATITNGKIISKIRSIDVDSYKLEDGTYVFFNEVHNWKLAPDKFDINTLVPFESRVLVRNYDNQIWIPIFWGKYLEDASNCSYLTTNGCYKYCIPYEKNEHLLGTTDDCDEFYKTWE